MKVVLRFGALAVGVALAAGGAGGFAGSERGARAAAAARGGLVPPPGSPRGGRPCLTFLCAGVGAPGSTAWSAGCGGAGFDPGVSIFCCSPR